MKYSSQNGEECFSDGARQLSYVIFSSVCLGEGIEIVGFIPSGSVPFASDTGETGKEVEGAWEEVLLFRGHSIQSGRGLMSLPIFIYLTSPCHLAPLKTASGHPSFRNVLSWPHSHPFPASALSLASLSTATFFQKVCLWHGLHRLISHHSARSKQGSFSVMNLYSLIKVTPTSRPLSQMDIEKHFF